MKYITPLIMMTLVIISEYFHLQWLENIMAAVTITICTLGLLFYALLFWMYCEGYTNDNRLKTELAEEIRHKDTTSTYIYSAMWFGILAGLGWYFCLVLMMLVFGAGIVMRKVLEEDV